MAYIMSSRGPGDIAALPPIVGLSMRPTISANDPGRPITPSMGSCCGVGNANAANAEARSPLLPVAIGAVIGGALYYLMNR